MTEIEFKLNQCQDALREARIALGDDDRPFLCDAIRELKAKINRLTELWMDAVCQGTRQEKIGDEYRHFDGAVSTWEEAFYELEQRGLAEGNDRDGWVLKWPEG